MEPLFDYSYLIYLIRKQYDSPEAFAEAMGMEPEELLSRLMCYTSWDVHEVYRAKELLDFSVEEIHDCFFVRLDDIAV